MSQIPEEVIPIEINIGETYYIRYGDDAYGGFLTYHPVELIVAITEPNTKFILGVMSFETVRSIYEAVLWL